MPSFLSEAPREQLQFVTRVTQQRMLREVAQALDALSAESPLVLLLEDLHWSDFSTLKLISTVARRSEPARLLIVGTYRPVELLVGDNPLRAVKEELQLHRQCVELRLKLLSRENVAEYLGMRFSNEGDGDSFSALAPAIHQRTEGNPLFMINVVDYLAAQGSLLDARKIETPHGIRQMVERNFERLTREEQAILETGSVAGAD